MPDAPRRPRLVLFPGLAADARAYAPQRRAFPWLEAPDWIDLEPGDTLASYADRMARRLPSPQDGERLFVGGFSFGGILALEAARTLPAEGVFFIGGALTGQAIAWPFRTLCHAAKYVPSRWVRPLLQLFPVGLDLVENLEDWQKELYVRMAAEVPPELIRWGATQLMRWEWAGPLPAPLWEIHGERDVVIPVTRTTPDYVVAGGRHLISLTHADEVNAFMAQKMDVRLHAPPAALAAGAPERRTPEARASGVR